MEDITLSEAMTMEQMAQAVQELERINEGRIQNPKTSIPLKESERLKEKALKLLEQESELTDTGLDMLSLARDLKHRFCYQAHMAAAGKNIIDARRLFKSLDEGLINSQEVSRTINRAIDLFEKGTAATSLRKSITYFRGAAQLAIALQKDLFNVSQVNMRNCKRF